MGQGDKGTRERILAAAEGLFYGEGVRAVSMDRLAEAAGVTKKTLYYHFRSKDDLTEAYLLARDQPNLRAFARWYDKAGGDPGERVAALFTGLARQAGKKTWRGCGFLRTAAELAAMPGHPAVRAGAAHKKRFEAWLADRMAEAGANDPAGLARQLVLLMEGVFSTLLFHRDPAYAEAAGTAARALVAAAIAPLR
jgi:AcrR family transcriptional regulator